MKRRKILKRTAAVLLALCCAASVRAAAEKLADRIGYTDGDAAAGLPDAAPEYPDYLEKHAAPGGPSGGAPVEMELAAFRQEGDRPAFRDIDGKNALIWESRTQSLSFDFHIETPGMYELQLQYYAEGGNALNISRGILIDGESPYEEAKNIQLPRFWKEAAPHPENAAGDQVRSFHEEIKKWTLCSVYDNQGLYGDPLRFALSEGAHRLTLTYIDQPVALCAVRFIPPERRLSYEEARARYPDAPAGKELRFEAESFGHILYKTNSAIIASSESGLSVSPSSLYHRRYNYLGGSNWAKGGDAVCWRFYVKEAGRYKLSFHMTQNGNIGLPAARRIEIDGAVPFEELLEYEIPYSARWSNHQLAGADARPFELYLGAGEHTLSMTAVMGRMAPLVRLVNDVNGRLANTYQNIVMITGQNPDVNYDYELDRAIPALADSLREISALLEDAVRRIKSVSEGSTSLGNSMLQVQKTINAFAKDADRIPSGLSDLNGALSTVGDWLGTLKTSTLALDYLAFSDPAAPLARDKESLWDIMKKLAVSVWQSFTKDYNSVGPAAGGTEKRTLEVWLSRGKEWAEMLKEISDQDFSKRNQTEVRMNLLPEGALSGTVNTLLLAINAGREPDVALGMSPVNAMEYAVRGAVAELSGFEGFPQIKSRHPQALYDALSFEGKTYAIPETMDFRVLFYRTDLFRKMKLSVPDTWDEVYTGLLPRLYQYRMQMYLPPAYDMFLYQHGGSYYNGDRTKTGVDSEAGMNAFRQMIANYEDYGFPYSASFYNRFRTGEIPVGIGGIGEYMQISYASRELTGKWSIAPVPSVDGNRSTGPALTAVSVVLASAEDKALAFSYLDWWSSPETQAEYGMRVESMLGMSARWATASTEAFVSLPWPAEHMRVITASWDWIRETPYVPGGYFTGRHVNHAISRCIAGNYNPRESLELAARQINIELARKRAEFNR